MTRLENYRIDEIEAHLSKYLCDSDLGQCCAWHLQTVVTKLKEIKGNLLKHLCASLEGV